MKYNFLFVNGWGALPTIFKPLMKSLESVTQRAIVLDWHNDTVLTSKEIHNTLKLLGDASPKASTVIIGWSSGTLPVLSYLASEHIHHSVCGSVLFGATPRFVNDNTPSYNFGWNKEVVRQMADNLVDHPQNVIQAFVQKTMSPNDISQIDLCTTYVSQFAAENISVHHVNQLKNGLLHLAQMDMRTELTKVIHPLCLITGSMDKICLPQGAEWIINHTAKSEHHILKQSGHAPMYFESSGCGNIINDFLKELNLHDR